MSGRCGNCNEPHHADDIGTTCRSCRRGIVVEAFAGSGRYERFGRSVASLLANAGDDWGSEELGEIANLARAYGVIDKEAAE